MIIFVLHYIFSLELKMSPFKKMSPSTSASNKKARIIPYMSFYHTLSLFDAGHELKA